MIVQCSKVYFQRRNTPQQLGELKPGFAITHSATLHSLTIDLLGIITDWATHAENSCSIFIAFVGRVD